MKTSEVRSKVHNSAITTQRPRSKNSHPAICYDRKSAIDQGPLTGGGVQTGGFPDLDFLVHFCPSWDFPDFSGISRFARGWCGDFPDS